MGGLFRLAPYIAVGGGLLFIFRRFDVLAWLSDPLIAAAVSLALFVLVAVASVNWIRRIGPDEVMAKNDAFEAAAGKDGTRAGWPLLFLVVPLCLGVLALGTFALVPRDAAWTVFLTGMGLIVAIVALPLLLVLAGWVAGFFVKPVTVRCSFTLTFERDEAIGDAPVTASFAETLRKALAARADPQRIAEVYEGISRAEPSGDGTGRFRLHPRGLTARIVGMGQQVSCSLTGNSTRLEIRAVTSRGDIENLKYTLLPEPEKVRAIAGELESRLVGPFGRLFVRLLGPEHVLKGGALVEARRFRKLSDCFVEADLRSAEILAED